MIKNTIENRNTLKYSNEHFYLICFCLDACQLILDVNSVHPSLHLSEGNRAATMKSEPKNYPEHPDRFDHWQQVSTVDYLQGV